jgi:hypothetical protein
MRHMTPARRLANALGYIACVAHDFIALHLLSGFATAGSTDWIPSTDGDLATFAANFSAVLTADPTAYGLTAGDASTFAALNSTYQSAYTTATNPSTRTPDAIAAKDAAKNALKPEMRRLGNLIQANIAVSDADKIAIGLTVRDTVPTPISAPSSFPLISVLSATPYNINLKINDSDTPTTNAKPAAAIACELYAQASATPLTDPEAISYSGLETRHLANLQFDAGDVGKTAYIVGRWVTRTGLRGPWSDIASMTIAA